MATRVSFPQDIINEIIDNVQDLNHVKSLCSLALTSHLFLSRSQFHLFTQHIHLNSLDMLNSFCNFLDAHPDRRLWVRSVTVFSATESIPSFPNIIPLRLLNTLPNLYRCKVGSPYGRTLASFVPQNPSHHVQVITHLSLDGFYLSSYTNFARYLLALSSLHHLQCENMSFMYPNDSVTALVWAGEHLSKKLHLSQLIIRHTPDFVVSRLLLESTQHTLQGLLLDVGDYSDRVGPDVGPPMLIPRLTNLTSITLETDIYDQFHSEWRIDIVQYTFEILRALASVSNSRITHINIHLRDRNIFEVLEYLRNHSDDLLQMCRVLEPALIRLPRLQKIELCYHLRRPLRNWTSMRIYQFFPTLCERGLIDTKCLASPIGHHNDRVNALAVTSSGNCVASGSYDGTIVLWDILHGTILHEWPAQDIKSLAFSRDGRHLTSKHVINDVGRTALMVWDVSDEVKARLVTTLEGPNICLWSSDGTLLALEASIGTIHIWNPFTNHIQHHRLEGVPGRYPCVWDVLPAPVLSPDGRWIASPGPSLDDRSEGSDWKIWDATTGTLLRILPGTASTFNWASGAFDPTGRRIIIQSNVHRGRIRQWDVETGDELAVLGDYTYELRHIAFSPDGTRVLSTASNDDQEIVILWDSFSGGMLLSFRAHEKTISQVCFSPDGRHVASASSDHTVRLWNASDGSCVRTFTEHDAPVQYMEFSPDGETLVSGGWDGKVCIRGLRDVCPEACSAGGP